MALESNVMCQIYIKSVKNVWSSNGITTPYSLILTDVYLTMRFEYVFPMALEYVESNIRTDGCYHI